MIDGGKIVWHPGRIHVSCISFLSVKEKGSDPSYSQVWEAVDVHVIFQEELQDV